MIALGTFEDRFKKANVHNGGLNDQHAQNNFGSFFTFRTKHGFVAKFWSSKEKPQFETDLRRFSSEGWFRKGVLRVV